jgi:hypothetical protein
MVIKPESPETFKQAMNPTPVGATDEQSFTIKLSYGTEVWWLGLNENGYAIRVGTKGDAAHFVKAQFANDPNDYYRIGDHYLSHSNSVWHPVGMWLSGNAVSWRLEFGLYLKALYEYRSWGSYQYLSFYESADPLLYTRNDYKVLKVELVSD